MVSVKETQLNCEPRTTTGYSMQNMQCSVNQTPVLSAREMAYVAQLRKTVLEYMDGNKHNDDMTIHQKSKTLQPYISSGGCSSLLTDSNRRRPKYCVASIVK